MESSTRLPELKLCAFLHSWPSTGHGSASLCTAQPSVQGPQATKMCHCPQSCLLITPKGDFEGTETTVSSSRDYCEFFQGQLLDFTFQTLLLQDTGACSSSWLLSCFAGSAAHGLPARVPTALLHQPWSNDSSVYRLHKKQRLDTSSWKIGRNNAKKTQSRQAEGNISSSVQLMVSVDVA